MVAADEREGGLRAILNLGHTFGHAIETAQGYGQWLHGEAVAAGMVLAVRLSAQLGKIASSEVAILCDLLQQAGLPTTAPAQMSGADFLRLMQRDKKVIDGRLRLVLLAAIGEAEICSDVSSAQIAALFPS